MGTFCIVLGLISLIGFTGVGFYAASALLSNQMYVTLLELNEPFVVYAVIVGACAFIGLIICASLVTLGLLYNRSGKNTSLLKKLNRRGGQSS